MDHYEVLGISRDATADQIKSAYRAMAKKFHPDRNPDDPEAEKRFRECAAAYEVLSDPERRRQYDAFGSVDRSGGFASDFPWSREQRQGEPGSHVVHHVSITLEDVLVGTTISLDVERIVVCGSCNGTGGKRCSCMHCNGTGFSHGRMGGMIAVQTCIHCEGSGTVVEVLCRSCHGVGYNGMTTEITPIHIPPGIESGTQMCFKGKGNPGRMGGKDGSLYVIVNVEPHKHFERLPQGDLLCRVPVTYSQLVLGADLEVPRLGGKGKFHVPAGTQSHAKFRVHGQGVPRWFGPVANPDDLGDLIIEVRLAVPKKLDATHRNLLERLAEIEEMSAPPDVERFRESLTNR